MLETLTSRGGGSSRPGGAGTVYLHQTGIDTFGRLIVDNATISGQRTVLPSLGSGVVQPGSAGTILVTGRERTIPDYFLGHWVRVEGPDRYAKGIWRIGAIDGTTITLVPKPGQETGIAPGDRWTGLYRLDDLELAAGVVLESVDPIVQLVSLEELARRSGSGDLAARYGNLAPPVWRGDLVTISVGAIQGSYRVDLAPGAVADDDGIDRVELTDGRRRVAASWTEQGVSLLWSGFPGERIALVAIDAHARVRRGARVLLPPLPDGGWEPGLALPAGAHPTLLEAHAGGVALAGEDLWLYADGPVPVLGLPLASEPRALAATAQATFLGWPDWLAGLPAASTTSSEAALAGSSLVALAAEDGRAALVLQGESGSPQAGQRLAEATLDGTVLTVTNPAEIALPELSVAGFRYLGGALHLFGHQPDGRGLALSWPSLPAGQLLTTEPEVTGVGDDWARLGWWPGGALLLTPNTVRVLEHGVAGWEEIAVLAVAGEPLAAAVADERLYVALAGEIAVYDFTDPAVPQLLELLVGSSHEALAADAAGTRAYAWTPGAGAHPVPLGPHHLPAEGDGFTPVVFGIDID